MSKILITGGSGLLGRSISAKLRADGHVVVTLGRKARGLTGFAWNVHKGEIDPAALKGVDTVIHLAGAAVVAKRWTRAYKLEIMSSRVRSTALLAKAIAEHGHQVRHFIGASATGYYGSPADTCGETHAPGSDFLSRVCLEWERSYEHLPANVSRTVFRLGVVLSHEGGAYPQLALAARFGLAATPGIKKRFFPWIHIEDAADAFVFAVKKNLTGTYNLVAPGKVLNRDFTRALAHSAGRRVFLPPVPAFMLRLLLGERADAVLQGAEVTADKLLSAGFPFRYASIEETLKDLRDKSMGLSGS